MISIYNSRASACVCGCLFAVLFESYAGACVRPPNAMILMNFIDSREVMGKLFIHINVWMDWKLSITTTDAHKHTHTQCLLRAFCLILHIFKAYNNFHIFFDLNNSTHWFYGLLLCICSYSCDVHNFFPVASPLYVPNE